MEETRLSGGRAVLRVIGSLAVSALTSLFLLFIFAMGLRSAADPRELAAPFALGALYAGAFAGGAFCGRLLGAGPLSGTLSGGAYCLLVFLAGIRIKSSGGRSAWLTSLLLIGIVAAGTAGAYLTQNRKRKNRRVPGKIRQKNVKARRIAKRRRAF